MQKSLKGHFLISNYTVQDPNFNQTVILIIDHDEAGAFGLVLNRNEDISLYEAVEGMPESAGNVILFEGGPVRPDALFVIHSDSLANDPGEEILPGIFLGSSELLLLDLLECPYPFHVYHGYSGWSPGQLEDEINSKTWVVLPANEDMIFHENPEEIWRNALSYKGGLHAYFARNVADPSLN